MKPKGSKYKILWDYGAYEGMKFDDMEFDTINEAVKEATSRSYTTKWLIVRVIVRVIEWEAKEL